MKDWPLNKPLLHLLLSCYRGHHSTTNVTENFGSSPVNKCHLRVRCSHPDPVSQRGVCGRRRCPCTPGPAASLSPVWWCRSPTLWRAAAGSHSLLHPAPKHSESAEEEEESEENEGWVSGKIQLCECCSESLGVRVLLTRVLYSTSSRSRRLSLRVYLALPVTASTGPLSTWCFIALNSM